MIVRIIGEGQDRLDDALIGNFNQLDARRQAFLDAGDTDHFSEVLHQMAGLIHERGQPLADSEFLRSDAIIPPENSAVDELRTRLREEGLIPG